MKAIRLTEDTRFKIIPLEMLHMFWAIMRAAELQGAAPTITGAAFNSYPLGKVHDAGYAIDVRTYDIKDPEAYANEIRKTLRAVSPHYVVLYGDPDHLSHVHIGFAWHYASESREGKGNGKRKDMDRGIEDRSSCAGASVEDRFPDDQGSSDGGSAEASP